MKTIMMFCLLAFAIFSCKAVDAQDKKAVREVIRAYEKALTTANLDGVLDVYTEDAVFMPQYSVAQVGKKAITRSYKYVFANLELDIKFDIHDIEVDGNMAWVRTSSPGRIKIKALNKWKKETHNEVFILKKHAGNWKIYRYIFSTTKAKT